MKGILVFIVTVLTFTRCVSQEKQEYGLSKEQLTMFRDSVRHMYQRGEIDGYFMLGQYMIELDSTFVSGYIACAYYYKSVQKYDSAIYYYEKGHKLSPLFDTSLILADLYAKFGKDSLELAELNDAIVLETYVPKGFIDAMADAGDLPTKDTVLLERNRKNIALKRRKDWYWEHKQYDNALDDMDSIIAFQPYGDYYFEKGKKQYAIGRYAEALETFKDVKKARYRALTDSVSYLAYSASCIGKLGDTQKALKMYQETLDEYTPNATLYYLRGITYFDIGRKEEGCEDWQKAIEMGMKIDSFNKDCGAKQ